MSYNNPCPDTIEIGRPMARFKGSERVRTKVGNLVLMHKGGGFTSHSGITEEEYERVASRLKTSTGSPGPTIFQLRQLKLKRGAFGRVRIVGTRYVNLDLKKFTQAKLEHTSTIWTRHLVDPD